MHEIQNSDGIPEALKKALLDREFSSLTPVQSAILKDANSGRDLRMASATGSGKTVAVAMAIARDISDWNLEKSQKSAHPKVLFVAPTRELAQQLFKELSWLYKNLNLKLAVVTGGTSIVGDFKSLKRGPHVLVGTPGRLVDHLKRGSVSFTTLSTVVLDEADEMLDMGFREDLEFILEQTPEERQTHLVSATFPRGVLSLAKRFQDNAIFVEGTPQGQPNLDISHRAMLVFEKDKFSALVNVALQRGEDRMLVFAQTRIGTAKTAMELSSLGFSAAALHGDMGQKERNQTLEAFRRGSATILVATDVAARGLDINNVEEVVHYDMPDNDATFTHRSGRTARAGKKGVNTVFVPTHFHRRAKQQARRLGIELDWVKVPSAKSIRKHGKKKMAKELAAIETVEETSFNFAAKLLEEFNPQFLVGALLSKVSMAGPCKAREIKNPDMAQVEKNVGMQRNGGRFGRGGQRSGGSGGQRGGGRGRPERDSQNYTRFHVNWGGSQGANPGRLVAMLCRRGDINGKEIGSIKIMDHSATVEVANSKAKSFAKLTETPDKRNPKIKIRPWKKN